MVPSRGSITQRTPLVPARSVPSSPSDAVVGSGGEQAVDDQPLRGLVHLGDHVGAGGLGVDRGPGPAQPVERAGRDASAASRTARASSSAGSGRVGRWSRRRSPAQRTRGGRRTPPSGTRAAGAAGELAWMVRHSLMARRVRTTTTAVPPAAMAAPTRAPRPVASGGVAGALEVDEGVADERAGGAGEEDRHEGQHSGPDGRERGAGRGRCRSGGLRPARGVRGRASFPMVRPGPAGVLPWAVSAPVQCRP